MSIAVKQLTELIEDTLHYMGDKFYSQAAINLLLGTYATESIIDGQTHLRQINGPALGIFQMEPATFAWIQDVHYNHKTRTTAIPAVACALFADIEWNLKLAIIMARLCYWYKTPEPLPPADDLISLASYYKTWYNSLLGHGSVQKFIRDYQAYMKGGEA